MTHTVSVSPSGPLTSIQEAINYLSDYVSNLSTAQEDLVILVGEGSYAGFTIPDSAFLCYLDSPYTIKISAAGNFFPVIDFNFSDSSQFVGIDIGASNPNFIIESLKIQYFAVGIRAVANSHEVKVNKCLVLNNRNVGILLEQCDNSQVLQSVVVNGDYGIVTRLCKNAAIIHNTIFLNGSLTTTPGQAISALWCEADYNYGEGISDTGRIHIIGNILYNTAGNALTLFYDDVENQAIVSNYNNIVLSSPLSYIRLNDKVYNRNSNSSSRRTFNNLNDWKSINLDIDSISSNPGFIKTIKTGASKSVDGIDLNILGLSPVLEKVPSFYTNAAATALWLPDHVNSADLRQDILGNLRNASSTAIGANDVKSSSGFYGEDVFLNPLELTAQGCAPDPIFDLLSFKSQKWFPKFKKGFFYVNDREFYLYPKKKSVFLGELACTSFDLPSTIVTNKPIEVKASNITLQSGYFEVFNNTVTVHHKDLPITTLEEEVEISCYTAKWLGESFSYLPALHRYKFYQGKTEYIFPEDVDLSCPVVVTDDLSNLKDPYTSTNREFSVVSNNGRAYLEFKNLSNHITNGQFDYTEGYPPLFWASSGATVLSGTKAIPTCYGSNIAAISGSGSFISKRLEYTTGDYTFSFHSLGSNINYEVSFYDSTSKYMGYKVTGTVPSTSSWQRNYMTVGRGEYLYTGFIDDPVNNLVSLGQVTPPDNPYYIKFKLSTSNNLTGYIDGTQYEEGLAPDLYHRKPFLDEITVEFNTSNEDYYVDYSQAISPARKHLGDGFVYIQEQAAALFGGPVDPSITTLNEIRWPKGRTLLPWARTMGHDKLAYRPYKNFNLQPLKPRLPIRPVGEIPVPDKIYLSPSTPVTFQNDEDGIGLSINCVDQFGNPLNNAGVSAFVYEKSSRFPGYLFKSEYGLKQALGQSITSKLDNGYISVKWIPPASNLGKVVTNIPIPIYSHSYGENIVILNTKYEISLQNYGNVSITDSSGLNINLEGSPLSTEIYFSSSDRFSIGKLKYMPKPGSISVYYNDELLNESPIRDINSNEFYVDYVNSTVYLKEGAKKATITYTPFYYSINEKDPYAVYIFYDRVLSGKSGPIILSHDYKINLQIQVEVPGYATYISKEFELIAQNSDSLSSTNFNKLGLEI